MKQTVRRQYNRKANDPFHQSQIMDYCTAKGYIDDAWAKRAKARQALKVYRECGLEGEMLKSSYFGAVMKRSLSDYRKAQRLCVRAYHKCMADIYKQANSGFY